MNMVARTIKFPNNTMIIAPNTPHSPNSTISPHVNSSQDQEYEIDPSSPRISYIDDGKEWLKLLLE